MIFPKKKGRLGFWDVLFVVQGRLGVLDTVRQEDTARLFFGGGRCRYGDTLPPGGRTLPRGVSSSRR